MSHSLAEVLRVAYENIQSDGLFSGSAKACIFILSVCVNSGRQKISEGNVSTVTEPMLKKRWTRKKCVEIIERSLQALTMDPFADVFLGHPAMNEMSRSAMSRSKCETWMNEHGNPKIRAWFEFMGAQTVQLYEISDFWRKNIFHLQRLFEIQWWNWSYEKKLLAQSEPS